MGRRVDRPAARGPALGLIKNEGVSRARQMRPLSAAGAPLRSGP